MVLSKRCPRIDAEHKQQKAIKDKGSSKECSATDAQAQVP
jgi:hypothetical protein